MHLKQFLKWIGLKEKLHFQYRRTPEVSEGDIWWASLGENIGYEISGKSKLFSRPVIIFRKLSKNFYLIIPLTTQMRTGTWYVNFKHAEREMTACLHQVRAIDYRRLSTRLGVLDPKDQMKIETGFWDLYKKIPHQNEMGRRENPESN